MARIWQEGFEDGLPYTGYLEGNPNSQYFSNASLTKFPNAFALSGGRGAYSSKSLWVVRSGNPFVNDQFAKTLPTSESEIYLRVYFKFVAFDTSSSNVSKEVIYMNDTSGNKLISIYNSGATAPHAFNIYVRKAGSYASTHSFTLSQNTWYKFDIYFKVNASTGAYEVKLDNASIKSETSINTGSLNISTLSFGNLPTGGYHNNDVYFDDIAVNNTSGSLNNSWCGNGTIISLKPKGTGNKSQWDTCAGYAKAESGSGTTTLKITGHGLSTNDVIFNKTRNSYSIVTYVDADTLTTSSITSQAQNDIILLYANVATIAATSGTSTSMVTIAGHTMKSGDVVVNTSRSNSIRRVIYVDSNNVYNALSTEANGTLGSTVTSQASGDSIKTFVFTPYAITNHWEAVSNQTDPSPKLAYIKSTTSGDIDTYDMQELVADKGLPSGLQIIAISHNVYAQEAGVGSEIKPVFRISGTDYEGDARSLTSGTLQYQKVYETSPATSVAWTQPEVDALEAGVKLV